MSRRRSSYVRTTSDEERETTYRRDGQWHRSRGDGSPRRGRPRRDARNGRVDERVYYDHRHVEYDDRGRVRDASFFSSRGKVRPRGGGTGGGAPPETYDDPGPARVVERARRRAAAASAAADRRRRRLSAGGASSDGESAPYARGAGSRGQGFADYLRDTFGDAPRDVAEEVARSEEGRSLPMRVSRRRSESETSVDWRYASGGRRRRASSRAAEAGGGGDDDYGGPSAAASGDERATAERRRSSRRASAPRAGDQDATLESPWKRARDRARRERSRSRRRSMERRAGSDVEAGDEWPKGGRRSRGEWDREPRRRDGAGGDRRPRRDSSEGDAGPDSRRARRYSSEGAGGSDYDDADSGHFRGNMYAPPQGLSWEEAEGETSAPPTSTEDYLKNIRPGVPPKLPPFLERKMLLGDLLRLLPMDVMLEEMSLTESRAEDAMLHARNNPFGDGALWNSGALPEYPRGAMYFTDARAGASVWLRSAQQSHATVIALEQRALHAAVTPAAVPHGTAVLFLVDAALRVAACLHAGKHAQLLVDQSDWRKRVRGPGTMIRALPRRDAPLFEGGPTQHARGPTAAVLRSSFGSLAYWPELRWVLAPDARRSVRYATATLLRAEVLMGTRVSKDQSNLADGELAAMSASLTAGVTAACAAAKFLYEALGRSLHPKASNRAYERLLDLERLVRMPMGSEELLRAESLCFGPIVEARMRHPSAVANAVIAAHVAARSAFTELMTAYVEGYDLGAESEDGELPLPSPDGEVTSAVVGAALLLQRLLGYLNVLSSYLTIASLYHGRDVGVWSETYRLYAFVMYSCSPLYRHATTGEFYDSRSAAMQELGVTPARGDPPPDERYTIEFDEPGEMDVLRLAPAAKFRDYLGQRVPLSEAIEGARDLVFGLDAIETTREHISGGRAIGGAPKGLRKW